MRTSDSKRIPVRCGILWVACPGPLKVFLTGLGIATAAATAAGAATNWMHTERTCPCSRATHVAPVATGMNEDDEAAAAAAAADAAAASHGVPAAAAVPVDGALAASPADIDAPTDIPATEVVVEEVPFADEETSDEGASDEGASDEEVSDEEASDEEAIEEEEAGNVDVEEMIEAMAEVAEMDVAVDALTQPPPHAQASHQQPTSRRRRKGEPLELPEANKRTLAGNLRR